MTGVLSVYVISRSSTPSLAHSIWGREERERDRKIEIEREREREGGDRGKER